MPQPLHPEMSIRVAEKHGIRRFLYPLQAELDFELPSELLLVDASGAVVPQHIDRSIPGKTTVRFAISMAPNETALLRFEPANGRVSVIPDPLKIMTDGGKIRSEQEKIAFEFGEDGLLSSVVYDGVEHLNHPMRLASVASMFQAHDGPTPTVKNYGNLNGTVEGEISGPRSYYPTIQCRSHMTSCKSWIEFEANLLPSQRMNEDSLAIEVPTNPAVAGQISRDLKSVNVIKIRLSLAKTSTTQTLDFGFGNGAYTRLEHGVIDGCALQVEFANSDRPNYTISTSQHRPNGERPGGNDQPRIDYSGSCESREDAMSRLWIHWNEPSKALAIAITHLAKCWNNVQILCSLSGEIQITLVSEMDVLNVDDNSFKISYHFLNAIPPIAAATNPASIICKPEVTVERVKPC
jgi:hypothetical protein